MKKLRPSRATFAEAALQQLRTLLVTLVEIVVVLNEVVDADHLDFHIFLFHIRLFNFALRLTPLPV